MCTCSPLVLALKPDLYPERLVHHENFGLDSVRRQSHELAPLRKEKGGGDGGRKSEDPQTQQLDGNRPIAMITNRTSAHHLCTLPGVSRQSREPK